MTDKSIATQWSDLRTLNQDWYDSTCIPGIQTGSNHTNIHTHTHTHLEFSNKMWWFPETQLSSRLLSFSVTMETQQFPIGCTVTSGYCGNVSKNILTSLWNMSKPELWCGSDSEAQEWLSDQEVNRDQKLSRWQWDRSDSEKAHVRVRQVWECETSCNWGRYNSETGHVKLRQIFGEWDSLDNEMSLLRVRQV